MAVKERAQQFERLLKGCVLWPSGELETMARGVIEQALLAERRLAKLEDAEFVAEYHAKESAYYNNSPSVYMQAQCRDIANALRAAAGKEVGK